MIFLKAGKSMEENQEKTKENQEKIEEKIENSKNSQSVLPILIFIVLCLIGVLAIFSLATSALDGISLGFTSEDNSNQNNGNNIENNRNNIKNNENIIEKIGKHEFKIPTGYEKQGSENEANGGLTASFMNKDINFLYISYLNQRVNLEDFAKEYGKELGNEGVKLTINGEPAYRFEIQSLGYSFYSYAMNINGDTYTFLISKETPNPDDFIAKLIIQ